MSQSLQQPAAGTERRLSENRESPAVNGLSDHLFRKCRTGAVNCGDSAVVKGVAIGIAGLCPAIGRIAARFQVSPPADPNLCMPLATIDALRADSLKCTILSLTFN